MCGEQSDMGTSTSGFSDNIIPLMLHTNIHSSTTDTKQSQILTATLNKNTQASYVQYTNCKGTDTTATKWTLFLLARRMFPSALCEG